MRVLQEKTPKDLWKEDIDQFMEELDVSEACVGWAEHVIESVHEPSIVCV